jgi:transposase
MTNEQRQALEAVAMDMWDPYIHTVKSQVPHVNALSYHDSDTF